MSAAQVRALLPARFNSFKRTPDAACPSDHFADLGLFAIYDKAGHLEAIELAPHAAKDPKLVSESVLVFAPGYYD